MSDAGSNPFRAPPPRRVNSAVWSTVIGTIMVVGCCCGLPCYLGSLVPRREYAAQKEAAPFQPHLADYVHMARRADTGTASAVLRGKVVAVRHEPLSVDTALWFQLPADLRAATPEEVAAIVLVERFMPNVGYYSQGGGKAYEFVVKIKVVEVASGQIIAEKEFRGSEVPRQFDRNQRSDVYGTIVDDGKIIEFLQQLRK